MKVTLITGTNSGIGMATALHLAAKGHRVYAGMRDLTRGGELREAAESRGLSLEYVELDVDDESSVNEAVAALLKREGQIDVLINNAGIGTIEPIEEINEATAKAVFETNFFGALRTVRAVLPQMREQQSGIIVNVSSVSGRIALFSSGIYTASKFALEAASESLAQEVLPYGIRVRIIEPGFIRTAMGGKALDYIKRAGKTAYPNQVERMRTMLAGGNENGSAPLMVAETIEAAINSQTAQLRFPTGDGAAAILDNRARMSDEEWIEMQRHQSDEDYFAEFAQRFSVESSSNGNHQPATNGLPPKQSATLKTLQRHMNAELTGDLETTMATMNDNPYVNNVPVMTGGTGREEVRSFYRDHIVGKFLPPDAEITTVSRTVGEDQIVEELVARFTHTVSIDWMLPEISPTDQRVEIAVAVVTKFENGKIAHVHTYWDQASVLVQLGLLDPVGLPVSGAASARKMLTNAEARAQ